MEKPHIDVNMSEMTAEEEDDKKFQVLIDHEENVALYDVTYKMHGRNHVDDDAEGREQRNQANQCTNT